MAFSYPFFGFSLVIAQDVSPELGLLGKSRRNRGARPLANCDASTLLPWRKVSTPAEVGVV
jgi:hypothetical protein